MGIDVASLESPPFQSDQGDVARKSQAVRRHILNLQVELLSNEDITTATNYEAFIVCYIACRPENVVFDDGLCCCAV